MAKDKDRTLNPAAQQRKTDKTKALKKAKVQLQAQRNERLAHRNPNRIQRQIDDLKALESSGEIKSREKAILADLERDLRAIHKAKEALGDKAPTTTGGGGGSGRDRDRPQHHDRNRNEPNANHTILGKRRHDGQRPQSSGSETDESVRAIPMPRDTPPPPPRSRMPYKDHKNANNSNTTSLPSQSNPQSQPDLSLPQRPTAPAKTTYSSTPQIRDLAKEAVSRFVPSVVKRKQDAVKGVGGALLEPEELDRLEAEGYNTVTRRKEVNDKGEWIGDDEQEGDEARRLALEMDRFETEMGRGTMDLDEAVEQGYKPARLEEEQWEEQQKQQQEEEEEEVEGNEEDDDEDEESYLPPAMSGGGGLFSKLPRPNTSSMVPDLIPRRQVEIEEVEDEDI